MVREEWNVSSVAVIDEVLDDDARALFAGENAK